ncbi:MAG: hypothetical protein WC340_10155 [Kiritimatiellia bacterium]
MRKTGLIVLLTCGALQATLAQNCWTNTAGRAFHATLVSMTETHALFVMQDNTTNRLATAALHPASLATARQSLGLPEIPASLIATFNLCRKDLKHIDNLYLDGRLDLPQRTAARSKILAGFKAMYQQHKRPPSDYAPLEKRLLSGK